MGCGQIVRLHATIKPLVIPSASGKAPDRKRIAFSTTALDNLPAVAAAPAAYGAPAPPPRGKQVAANSASPKPAGGPTGEDVSCLISILLSNGKVNAVHIHARLN
eukprot:4317987-Amphidinium_carterae.1